MLWAVILILIILCIYLFISKKQEKNRIGKINNEIKNQNQILENNNKILLDECNSLKERKSLLCNSIQLFEEQLHNQKESIEKQLKEYTSTKEKEQQHLLEKLYKEYIEYEESLEQAKQIILNNHNNFVKNIQDNQTALEAELKKLKSSHEATIQYIQNEQKHKQHIDFYRICVSEEDCLDLEILKQVRRQLSKPEILDKLIWTTYYQKPTSAMVSNIVGDATVCGIYKITSLNSKKVYVGQSVDIGERFKQHVKAALGATPATSNKLYTTMRAEKVENFTFEILEICPRADLKERERYWIEYFQSDTYGLNGTGGNL